MWENSSIPITQFLYVLQCFWMTVTQAGNVACVFLKSFVFKALAVLSKTLYHKKDALSIRLRFRWRGAVCYTSQDLRSLTNAAHLLAHLRCPKFSAKGRASLKIQTAAPKQPALLPLPAALGCFVPRATLVGLIIEDLEIKPCLYNKKSLTPMV